MIHIWHEDSSEGATTQFWKLLKYYNVSDKLKDADIRGFNGNKHLVEYIRKTKINDNEQYFIFLDIALDNQNVRGHLEELVYKYARHKDNMHIINIPCFEYILLKFRYIVYWTSPNENSRSYKTYLKYNMARVSLLSSIENENSWAEYSILRKYVAGKKLVKSLRDTTELSRITTERLAKIILRGLNSLLLLGYTVSNKLGFCWYCDYCKDADEIRNNGRKCRRFSKKTKAKSKANTLWKNSMACEIINNPDKFKIHSLNKKSLDVLFRE